MATQSIRKNDRVTYRGNVYVVRYIGQTQYGFRAKLAYLNGAKEFWCSASELTLTNGPAPAPKATVAPPVKPEPAPVIVADDQDEDWNTVAPVAKPSSNGTVASARKDMAKSDFGAAENHHAFISRAGGDTLPEWNVERVNSVLDKIRNEGGLRVVNYYIPAELSQSVEISGERVIRCPSPAAVFHRYAIHLDGSNWIFTEKDLAREEVQWFFRNWQEHASFRGKERKGPRGWARKQHPDEERTLLLEGLECLGNRLHELRESLTERIVSAGETMVAALKRLDEEKNGGTEKERKLIVSKRFNTARAVLKETADNFRKAMAVATKYGMADELEDLFTMLRQAVREHRDEFNEAADKAGVRLSDAAI